MCLFEYYLCIRGLEVKGGHLVFQTPEQNRMHCSHRHLVNVVTCLLCFEVSLKAKRLIPRLMLTRSFHSQKTLVWTVISCENVNLNSWHFSSIMSKVSTEISGLWLPFWPWQGSGCFVKLAGYCCTCLPWGTAVLSPVPDHGRMLTVSYLLLRGEISVCVEEGGCDVCEGAQLSFLLALST